MCQSPDSIGRGHRWVIVAIIARTAGNAGTARSSGPSAGHRYSMITNRYVSPGRHRQTRILLRECRRVRPLIIIFLLLLLVHLLRRVRLV